MAKRITIVANGSFPKSRAAISALESCDILICCDGAAEQLILNGYTPHHIVGDMDSLSYDLQERFRDIIYPISSQENNDLTKAFNFARTLDAGDIKFVGATGKREDHTLGNISLLAEYANYGTGVLEMITDYGKFVSIKVEKEATFDSTKNQSISIFTFDQSVKIKSEGLLYPTDDVEFNTLWKATLNRASGQTFKLKVDHPSILLIYFADLCL